MAAACAACVCILPPMYLLYYLYPPTVYHRYCTYHMSTYLGTAFHQDLTPIELHEVRFEVCIQNSKTFRIRTQHTGTRESLHEK